MNENDPHWDADPLWYDRAEPEALPGRLLNGLAYLVLLLLAGMAGVVRLYRLPDALWCRAAGLPTKLDAEQPSRVFPETNYFLKGFVFRS
ncbi:hypothetical protein FV242_24785 [Methylobacterium sp. WL64]|uniref:hypothetical protein n=1 Tax=Methylobacterium sp. WL64 TaxID=2603894 RepID=UPI0011C74324|nr:hypothetical protein [Methylobacterium sp. WL64]TXM99655.1 hypothetical protein FV242_24785 [Methylobacterium sp. WL64]